MALDYCIYLGFVFFTSSQFLSFVIILLLPDHLIKLISIWCWFAGSINCTSLSSLKMCPMSSPLYTISLYIQGELLQCGHELGAYSGLSHSKLAFLRHSCLPLKSSSFVLATYLHRNWCLVVPLSPLFLVILV